MNRNENAKKRVHLEDAVEEFCIEWYGQKGRSLSDVTDEDLIFWLKSQGFTASDIMDPEIRSWVKEIDAQIRAIEETEKTAETGSWPEKGVEAA